MDAVAIPQSQQQSQQSQQEPASNCNHYRGRSASTAQAVGRSRRLGKSQNNVDWTWADVGVVGRCWSLLVVVVVVVVGD